MFTDSFLNKQNIEVVKETIDMFVSPKNVHKSVLEMPS